MLEESLVDRGKESGGSIRVVVRQGDTRNQPG